MIRSILAICFSLSVVVCYGQLASSTFEDRRPTVRASLDRDSIGIGDRITLSIEVEQDVMDQIAFPDLAMDGDSPLEILGEPSIDTVESAGRRLRLRRSYIFTTFEAGHYNLGRMSILAASRSGGVDTLRGGDSLRFFVNTFAIDSTSHTIFDLKAQRTLDFRFAEIRGYVIWSVVGLLLLLAALYVALRLMAHFGRPVMGLFKAAPPVAPHVAAFMALDSLKSERLWQDGDYKSYYSRLSDILRTYLSGRYGVAAMEMTSDEIITASKELDLPTQCEMELRDLLRDADLVKFAKAEFEGSLNERYFESARTFVDLTKEVEEEPDLGERSEDEE